LQAIRSRRNLIAVILFCEFLGFFPFLLLVTALGRRFFSSRDLFVPATLVFGALYIFTVSRIRRYPCPRCGTNFLGGFFATPETVLGRNCAHCGLPKYSEE
jgi:hypothetical protein